MVFPKSILFLSLVVAAFGCMALESVQAATLGDPEKGKIYAQTHCVSCHSIVRDGNSSPVAAATPFQKFADTAGITRTALFVFFRSPHPTMPNLVIKGDHLDNIIAYILSLKTTDK